jgi:hypothetical protein
VSIFGFAEFEVTMIFQAVLTEMFPLNIYVNTTYISFTLKFSMIRALFYLTIDGRVRIWDLCPKGKPGQEEHGNTPAAQHVNQQLSIYVITERTLSSDLIIVCVSTTFLRNCALDNINYRGIRMTEDYSDTDNRSTTSEMKNYQAIPYFSDRTSWLLLCSIYAFSVLYIVSASRNCKITTSTGFRHEGHA